ncbi:MAG TPA: nucleotidyltransferase family protein [Gaiellaceae bacterium]|nr:nucleotidyltransferase family protein [Gaiellaceae bacterium]
MSLDVESFCISPDQTLRDAMACIDRNAEGIALVVDEERRLLGTISDGDTRRAILAGTDLDLPVRDLLAGHPSPTTAPVGTPAHELLHMMNERVLRQIPLVDDDGRVVDVALMGDLVRSYELPLTAVVMAGGFGTRLSPLTADIPKPMLRVGDTPMLERIVKQLRDAGIRRVNVATHYRGDVIADHFKDGSDFGVELEYVHEDEPLGTAGALGRMEHAKDPLLVINGDILTHVDFRAMLHFHREHMADMTVAVRDHTVAVPYGIVEIEDTRVVNISEKPTLRYLVNAGIYLLDASAVARVPRDQSSDMTHLIESLVADGARVVGFPIHEYWIDIGRLEDYERALADFEALRSKRG